MDSRLSEVGKFLERNLEENIDQDGQYLDLFVFCARGVT